MGVIIESATTIDDLFNGERKFLVPDFQRNYSWNTDQLKAFWEDVNNRLGQSHFFGPMTWRKTGNDFYVIDGQQRITTLQILFAVMRDFCLSHLDNPKIHVEMEGGPEVEKDLYIEIQNKIYRQDGYLFFQSNRYLNSFLKNYVLRAPQTSTQPPRPTFRDFMSTNPPSKSKYKHALKAIDFFSNEILKKYEASSKEATTQFLKEIFATCKLLEIFPIEVSDESEAFVLFESLNDRGLFLAPSDLLKSHLMEQGWQQEQEQGAQRVLEMWDRASEFAGAPMEEVLMYMLLTKRSNVDVKKVFQLFKELVGEKGYQSVLTDVIRHCKLHGVLVNDESAIRELELDTDDYKKLLQSIQFISYNKRLRTVRILLLAILEIDCEIAEKIKMTQALESLVYRWHLMGKHKQDFKNHMSRLAQILTKPSQEDQTNRVNEVTEELIGLIPSNLDFQNHLFGLAEPNSETIRALLHRIETTYATDETDPLTGTTQLEHIAPQTSTAWWVTDLGLDTIADNDEKEASYEAWVQMWGNITLLGESLNKQAKQEPWLRKLEGFTRRRGPAFRGYRGSYVKLTQDLRNLEAPRWSPELIRERTLWLYSAAIAMWGEDGQEYVDQYPEFSYWRRSSECTNWKQAFDKWQNRHQEEESTSAQTQT